MFLKLGTFAIADNNTDASVRWLRVATPDLSINGDSVTIVGARYERNISRASGLSLTVVANVGRLFESYAAAELFALKHIAQMSNLPAAALVYKSVLGTGFAWANARLDNVKFTNETGINVETEYTFKCGAPLAELSYAFICNRTLVSTAGLLPTNKGIL